MATIAITGASGKLARATLQYLQDRDVPPASVVAVARDLSKVSDLAASGFQTRRGDYTDQASLEQAFQGVDKLIFVSTSVVGDERMRHHKAVVEAARRARVGHVLYTSVIKPSANAKFAAAPGHFHTEQLIRDSGVPHTFFRNNLYMDIIPFVFAGAVETGELIHCAGEGRIGFVPRADMAQGLANAAVATAPLKPSYDITTNRTPYSLADVAAALGKANSTSVIYKSVSPEELRKVLEQRGVPEPGIGMALAIGEAIRAGEFDASSEDLEKLIGRPPTTLDAFFAK
jgi:NAD(P)H dehydrogenase (quinone)